MPWPWLLLKTPPCVPPCSIGWLGALAPKAKVFHNSGIMNFGHISINLGAPLPEGGWGPLGGELSLISVQGATEPAQPTTPVRSCLRMRFTLGRRGGGSMLVQRSWMLAGADLAGGRNARVVSSCTLHYAQQAAMRTDLLARISFCRLTTSANSKRQFNGGKALVGNFHTLQAVPDTGGCCEWQPVM